MQRHAVPPGAHDRRTVPVYGLTGCASDSQDGQPDALDPTRGQRRLIDQVEVSLPELPLPEVEDRGIAYVEARYDEPLGAGEAAPFGWSHRHPPTPDHSM